MCECVMCQISYELRDRRHNMVTQKNQQLSEHSFIISMLKKRCYYIVRRRQRVVCEDRSVAPEWPFLMAERPGPGRHFQSTMGNLLRERSTRSSKAF